MNLPPLTIKVIPGGNPFPVLLCLPDETPVVAIAELYDGRDPVKLAEEIVAGLTMRRNHKTFYPRSERR